MYRPGKNEYKWIVNINLLRHYSATKEMFGLCLGANGAINVEGILFVISEIFRALRYDYETFVIDY